MKQFLISILLIALMGGCTQKKKVGSAIPGSSSADTIVFFPVTDFFKGQLAEIRSLHLNPLKYFTTGNKTDSSWLKVEDLEKEMAPFLHPVIDSLNLVPFFTEKKFLDQSVNAFTFTYDPIKTLPDTMQLQHWDIYINPEDGKVRRIYMVKKLAAHIQQQLTWQTGEWCRIVNLKTADDGSFTTESEQKITWNF